MERHAGNEHFNVAKTVVLTIVVFAARGSGARAEFGQLVSTLEPPRNAASGFGVSVAVSGTTAVVGSGDNRSQMPGFNDEVYVFDVDSGQLLTRLIAEDDIIPAGFGMSVDIDGSMAIVGTRDADLGAAYVYDVATGDQVSKLEPLDRQADQMFGHDVAITGSLAIVGAPLDDSLHHRAGAAYVFDINTGQQLYKLTAHVDDGIDRTRWWSQFGTGVASDGTLAVVGEFNADRTHDPVILVGGAYVFDLTTGELLSKLERRSIPEPPTVIDDFGGSIDLDGATALIGASGFGPGAAFLFDLVTGEERFQLAGSESTSRLDRFGWSVAVDGDVAVAVTFGWRDPNIYFFDVATGEELLRAAPYELGAPSGAQLSAAVDGGIAVIGAPDSGVALVIDANREETTGLQAGDADQDLDFDQLDLVKVLSAGKYRTGEPSTWGEGDWNGAPGGSPGDPPPGDGVFDQLDIVAAQQAGLYLTGSYGVVAAGGSRDDGQTSIIYDAKSGELALDAPRGRELTYVNIASEGERFRFQFPPMVDLPNWCIFDGACDADNIFYATFGESVGSISFGNVLPASLSEADVAADLTVVGGLAGGGNLGVVDLIYIPVPEPEGLFLLFAGILIGTMGRFRKSRA